MKTIEFQGYEKRVVLFPSFLIHMRSPIPIRISNSGKHDTVRRLLVLAPMIWTLGLVDRELGEKKRAWEKKDELRTNRKKDCHVRQ